MSVNSLLGLFPDLVTFLIGLLVSHSGEVFSHWLCPNFEQEQYPSVSATPFKHLLMKLLCVIPIPMIRFFYSIDLLKVHGTLG